LKKLLVAMLVLGVLIISTVIYGQTFWGGETMSSQKVKKKWGSEKYNAEAFKAGTYLDKSKMAYSIMTDKKLLEQPYEKIRELFGENDGFYFIDSYPTYIIQRGKNHSEETWQLVFRMNSKFKVRDVIMHKNCCDK